MNPRSRTAFGALAWVLAPIAVVCFATTVRAADASQNRVLTYKAVHTKYGDIGTYSNTIAVKDGVTTVTNQVRLRVRVLGITAHREEGDRTEQWKDGRLMAFQGITAVNGDRFEVKGEAKGDTFAVTTPSGTVAAPADIRLSNPWSDNFIGATMMMAVDSGRLQPVSVGKGEKTPVKLGDATVESLRFDIVSKPPYQVWLDGNRIPVMFNVDDESGIVTFTLVK